MPNGGLLKGQRFMAFVGRGFHDRPIEDLAIPFAAVATSLETGAEVWLRTGSTLAAVRASLAMPGLFTPVLTQDGVLVDGALVNPVPVSLARAMGADVVIAVDLSSGILGRGLVVKNARATPTHPVSNWVRKSLGRLLPDPVEPPPSSPSVMNVIATSLDVMQMRITRSRMAGEPPDVIVAPRSAISACSISRVPTKRFAKANAPWSPRSAASRCWESRRQYSKFFNSLHGHLGSSN